MASSLQRLRRNRTITSSIIRNPSCLNFFSSSSIPKPANNVQEEATPSPKSQSSFSSYSTDVKSSLRQQQRSPFEPPPADHFHQYSKPVLTGTASKISSFDEIRKNLSEFRRRTAVPPPFGIDSHSSFPSPGPRASPTVSLQELYKKNVAAKSNVPNTNDSGKFSFDMIRQSIKQLRPTTDANNRNDSANSSRHTDRLFGAAKLTGGTSVPHKVFGKESNKKAEPGSVEMKRRFVKPYNYGELGERLRMLRPEEAKAKTENWFSLKELSERLMKLREIDEKEPVSGPYSDLRESLSKLTSQNEASKTKRSS